MILAPPLPLEQNAVISACGGYRCLLTHMVGI